MESLSAIIQIRITFSNLKSVECFEFDKNFLETTYIDVKKEFLLFLIKEKKKETANSEYR